jgi:hypothetical protein
MSTVFHNGQPIIVFPDYFRACPVEMAQLREEAHGEPFFMLEINGGQRFFARERKELEEMVKNEPGYRYAITKILGKGMA